MNNVGKELYNEYRDNMAKLGVSVPNFEELPDTDRTAWQWMGEFVTRKGYESTL